ncbi:MAG: MotA/TolQ/ExbB proton channel family protein [Candidatus Omnitrophica bacterium]|nr:MotA/TolQ/ExbB proton channel family protein [Candidatus Omnitrophota bacterium]
MWPLLACSVIGVAIIIERALYFWQLRFSYSRFASEIKTLLSRRKIKEALILCRRHSNPVPRIAEFYLKNMDGDSLRNEILKREGSYALEKVETRLRALAAITHLAPLLGLLGTVTGLVAAFHQIEILGGQVQPGDLAAGIWEALITTVFGLMIAIPCMAAYHGFESAADKIARRMQFIISELDEFFGKHSAGDFKSEDIEATDQSMRAIR